MRLRAHGVDPSGPICFDVLPGGSVGLDDGGHLCADDRSSDDHAIWNATLTNQADTGR